jgi:hypothetical protein
MVMRPVSEKPIRVSTLYTQVITLKVLTLTVVA